MDGDLQTIRVDRGAEKIIRQLEAVGYEAFAVGGCVRDALLGNQPADWDITTNARPETVKSLFPRTFDTGIEHGTVTVMDGSVGYEVTTYRIDGEYLDHRRPESVSFAGTLYEDVARRDFTINAMACHPDKGIMDFFSGREDLRKRLIRCVGDPEKRFEEDALRMLRAVRFSAKLDFDIEPSTWDAIGKRAKTLAAVSKERIMEELTKTLLSDHPEKLELAEKAGLTASFAEAWKQGLRPDYADLRKVPAERVLRFSVLLQHVDPSKASILLRQLKADNDLRNGVVHLLEHLREEAPEDGEQMRRWLSKVGRDHLRDLLLLRVACGVDTEEKKEQLRNLAEQEKNSAVTLAELDIDGRVLIKEGAAQGKEIGEALTYLLDKVLGEPSFNEREKLIDLYRNMARR